MSKRIERVGMDLEMEVMRRCARELEKLPVRARIRVADWIQQSALDTEVPEPPLTDPNKKQQDIFPGG
jgi:hypothetical protein